jgi:vacuolar-type H+-ATPase subunit E/Vma4
MVQFIKQEAEEKANEIAVAAEEARARRAAMPRHAQMLTRLPPPGVQH